MRLFALGWTLAILVACSIPGSGLPRVDGMQVDKLVHFGLFAGFGLLWILALQSPLRRRTGFVLFVGLAYAVLTELYQGLLPFERTPDALDALANALGLVVGIGLARWILARYADRFAA